MAKTIAWIFGLVFVVVAILGFIGTTLVGPEGYFVTDTAHDIVHFISGLAFIALVTVAPRAIPAGLKTFGIVYLLIAVLGFLIDEGELLGFIEVNHADHWFHVVLGIVILALGFVVTKPKADTDTPAMPMTPPPTNTPAM